MIIPKPEFKDADLKYCKVPYAIPETESHLYRKILAGHCSAPDKDSPDHQCQGALTITRASIVARCKRCGDCKGVLLPVDESGS